MEPADILELRNRSRFLSSFEPNEVADLVGHCTERRKFAAGQTVFERGSRGDHMYLVLRGRVALTRIQEDGTEIEETLVEGGGVVGVAALLYPGPRTRRAVAMAPTLVLTLGAEGVSGFDQFTAFRFHQAVARELATHLRAVTARVAHLRASEQSLNARYRKLAARRATTGTQLRGVDLSGSTIENCDLRKADLRGGTQREMRFLNTELRKADLRGADLRDAWFVDTDLRASDFTGANLSGAVFRGCELSPNSFDGAVEGFEEED